VPSYPGSKLTRHKDRNEIYLNDENIVGVTGFKVYNLIMTVAVIDEMLKRSEPSDADFHEGGDG
jgi:hypothetical protein